jgi:hypothetical protein
MQLVGVMVSGETEFELKTRNYALVAVSNLAIDKEVHCQLRVFIVGVPAALNSDADDDEPLGIAGGSRKRVFVIDEVERFPNSGLPREAALQSCNHREFGDETFSWQKTNLRRGR